MVHAWELDDAPVAEQVWVRGSMAQRVKDIARLDRVRVGAARLLTASQLYVVTANAAPLLTLIAGRQLDLLIS